MGTLEPATNSPRIVTPPAVETLPGCPKEASLALEWLNAEIATCVADEEKTAGKPADLYHREWVPIQDTAGDEDSLTSRFKMMQFNVLAEGLSKEHTGMHMSWPRRRWRVLEEIIRCNPDILAVEELDHYHDFLQPALAALGYASHWLAKPRSPCLAFDSFSDGSALFWKTEVFELSTEVTEGQYHDSQGGQSNQGYVLADLRHLATKQIIRCVATHLKAGLTPSEEATRNEQVKQLLAAVSAAPTFSHAIICGDFNSTPADTSAFTAKSIPAMLAHEKLPLQNATAPLPYTFWILRDGEDLKLVLDYIFHTAALKPTSVFDVPDAAAIEPSRLPGLRNPSDHFAIAVEFAIRAVHSG
eukprot:TRINITY_DN22849_c0_g1_i3.p1 TRINITY_DN22849_c0_g1~~TRINITY_DN22849_c0_g1_i3.p1  ORF type:complete len:370 (-),score=54.22 TRINITY_DN22849_c0_g1_i3:71-1144(-)